MLSFVKFCELLRNVKFCNEMLSFVTICYLRTILIISKGLLRMILIISENGYHS